MKQPAIFLDRDATIIKDNGYLKRTDEVKFFPETFASLLKLQVHFQLFIITNQSGISKGVTKAIEVQYINKHIVEIFKSKGITIKQVFCCPHSSDENCVCKKPKPYFINKAAELHAIDLENSYRFGDHPSDVECGLNAGIKSIYLLTGHREKHKNELISAFLICENISTATQLILKN